MKKLLEQYPPEDLANLNAYAWLGIIMILIAEFWKVIIG
jgi:hypothetical protein